MVYGIQQNQERNMTKVEVSNLIKSLEKRRMKAFRYHDDKTYNVLTNRLNLAHDEYFDLISTTKQVDFKMKQEEEFRQKTVGKFDWEKFLPWKSK